VSRSWRDRLLIALAPQGLALLRIARPPRARTVAALVAECEVRPGAAPWEGAVAALGGALAALKDAAADATVVLSNHFVRYALVPRDAQLSGAEQELAYARYCFSRIHGERSQAWEVRLAADHGEPVRLASAVDAALLEAVRGSFAGSGRPRLVSAQPYLMAAFNRWRRLPGARPAWLLLVEAGRACLAGLDGSRWIAVRNVKGDFSAPARWRELLERERCLADAAAAPREVLVHAPLGGGEPEADDRGQWRYRPLGDPAPRHATPGDHPLLAMARCTA
jgi:hypothetical protein